jgi:hypothetical protein
VRRRNEVGGTLGNLGVAAVHLEGGEAVGGGVFPVIAEAPFAVVGGG